jgi:hypothetical protein
MRKLSVTTCILTEFHNFQFYFMPKESIYVKNNNWKYELDPTAALESLCMLNGETRKEWLASYVHWTTMKSCQLQILSEIFLTRYTLNKIYRNPLYVFLNCNKDTVYYKHEQNLRFVV